MCVGISVKEYATSDVHYGDGVWRGVCVLNEGKGVWRVQKASKLRCAEGEGVSRWISGSVDLQESREVSAAYFCFW